MHPAMIDERFERTVAAALARAPRRPGRRLVLPEAVRGSIAGAAALEGGVPEVLAAHYLERTPAALVEQLWVADDEAARLLWRPFAAAPRLRAALAGMYRVLGADAPMMLGAASPEALLAARPSAAELYAGA